MRYLVVILVCLPVLCFTQNDSIQELLNQSNVKDSLYITRLVALSDSFETGDVDKQLTFLNRAKSIAKTNNDSLNLGVIYERLTRAYNSKGVYDKAIESALSAKRIYDNIDNVSQRLTANSRLINIYRNNGYAEKAIELSKENLSLVRRLPIDRNTGRYYFDLGVSYSANEQLDSALVYYQKATKLAEEANFKPGEMFMKQATGQLYKKMNRYAEAEAIFNEVLPYYKSTNNKAGIARINYSLATLASLRSQHQKSISYYEKSLALNSEMNRLEFVKDINQKLFIAYNIVQDTAKANEANRVYNIIKDSLDSKERKALIADMKTKYETEKIEAESKLNAKEAELAKAQSQRNFSYLLVALVGLALVIIAGLLYANRLKQQKKTALIQQELKASQKQLALEKQYRDSELKALKAQMNPHFIFNVLNSIQEYIVINQKEKASEYLATFAELIRSYLNFSNEELITLQQEVDSISNYLELEQLRFGDSLNYTISVSQTIDKNGILLPTMLIQPYVENALKHGLFHKEGQRNISISFDQPSENTLSCVIEDNGIGRKASVKLKNKKNDYKSFASSATQERLELLNQRYHCNIGVTIIDIEDKNDTGTRVELTIPIQLN